jgi:hypothetical protein
VKRAKKAAPTRGSRATQARATAAVTQAAEDSCQQCGTDLSHSDRALFVEEEVGRIFCTEECIRGYFTPEIERMEKEYFRFRAGGDLPATERESLAHLRWLTLEEPDEIWREKTLTGDHRYTLISQFEPGEKTVWCVCICLFLRGEPSFLYLAFPTRNQALVDHYRRGERVQWARPKGPKAAKAAVEKGEAHKGERHMVEEAVEGEEAAEESAPKLDGLAEAWTEEETLRAQLIRGRSPEDVPPEQYERYQAYLEETLETPDEVWTTPLDSGNSEKGSLYHFIREYAEEKPEIWYVVVARDTDDENQIEILDAFPTRDPALVDRHRRGTREVGEEEPQQPSRLVH